ncbi:MAG: Stk1 family PASTA domain-containing Ser/Thr kinase, partial [Bacilli bacterium]|nr:Stk1 family PASTA domain-containing Ser/Thr kinase [Bacilli bacterium]
LSGDEKFVRRFQREALAASSLSHPNIVEMYDVGEDKGMYYIVMEYVKGVTLKQLLKKRGALTLSECIDIMLQLTDGISHAHASYIIHRDIKPQNIMIQDNGEIKITDFGIAIALNNTQMTQTNSIMGSVHYLPPEQASGKVATVKSDIYSMGIMFYELLTGSLPFKGDTAFEIALKQIKDDIPSVRDFNNSIPQSVENVVLKATAKNPKNRYSSAKEMHDDLLTVLDENRLDEPRIGFKYVEHDGNITKDDLIIDENDERKNGIKLEEDTFEAGHKTNVVLWVLSGIFTMIILALVILFLVSPSINKVPDVKIPDVKNMTVIEAEKVLHKEGFEVASEIEQIGSDEVEKGFIVKTSPSIGRTVKKGTEITLYESKGPLKYTIEDYTGKNYIEVKTILENNYGLNVVIEKMEVDDEQEYDENIIISQDLKVGTEVSKGANITLYIPDIVVKYPDFTDGTWSQSDIESFCKKYGIDVEFKYEPKPGFNDGDIISQSRAKDTPVIRGVKIEIHVATTYEPPEDDGNTN